MSKQEAKIWNWNSKMITAWLPDVERKKKTNKRRKNILLLLRVGEDNYNKGQKIEKALIVASSENDSAQ